MCKHRLHVAEFTAGTHVLYGRDAHYLRTVRRAVVGETVELFDGLGTRAVATITSVTADEVLLAVAAPETRDERGLRITLAPALLKGDKLADVVRPATELGVEAFQPLITARADVKVLSPNRRARLTRIAQEASRQSGRTVVPTVHDAIALHHAELPGLVVVAHPTAKRTVFDVFTEAVDAGALTVVTGPEGGFTEDEIAHLQTEHGAVPISLGSTILRAETAPVAVAAAVALWNAS